MDKLLVAIGLYVIFILFLMVQTFDIFFNRVYNTKKHFRTFSCNLFGVGFFFFCFVF